MLCADQESDCNDCMYAAGRSGRRITDSQRWGLQPLLQAAPLTSNGPGSPLFD
jgi:hypothetical protein